MYFENFHSVKYAQSLVVKLIAIAVTLVVMGGALRYLLIERTLKDGITEVVNQQQLSLAKYVAEDIDAKLAARRQLLQGMANDVPLSAMAHPADMQKWLQSGSANAALFTLGLVVIPANGKGAIADYPPLPGRRELDFNDRDWFIEARDQGRFAIGKPGIGRAAKEAVVNMAMPIRDDRQQIVGVLMGVTALNSTGFLDLVQKSLIGQAGGMLVVSPRDKLIVTASDPALRLHATPAAGVNAMHDRAMQGWQGAGVTVNAQGVEELAAVAAIPSANWFLVTRTPTTEAFRTVERLLANVLKATVVVGGLALVFIALLLLRIFRPLVESAHRMQAMARGDTPLAALPLQRHDEVGSMVKGFNELVDKLQQTQTQMSYLAHHDPLTGLPNRMAFQASMAQSIALADRQKSALAVLFIDLDGFKAINDTHGHEAGDQLLQQVALRLRDCVRASDIAGRLGGDEFVLLLTDQPDAADASQIADKVIARLTEPYAIRGAAMRIGASVGIALFPRDATTAAQLLVLADSAMYVAKRRGGNRHHASGDA